MELRYHFLKVFFILIFFFFSPHAIALSPQDNICNSTPFPYFCKQILPKNQSATIHDYGRYTIQHSLLITNTFVSLINGFIRLGFAFPVSTLRAMYDCRELAITSQTFLSQIIQTIGSTTTLPDSNTDTVQTLLSATLTNFQTCIDGLQESGSGLGTGRINALSGPLNNGSMAYSVALALFMKGWGPAENHVDKLRINNGRKLFQTGGGGDGDGGGVKVIAEVVVDPSGGGDYMNITAAVAAAPNNTAAGNGYFVINVVGGIYEEYVNIGKNKKFIMMIGEGQNKTVITGNRNVVDGWTTFNSASFAVTGQGFVAINITFTNTAGPIKHQAVAVRNGADLSTFYQCNIEGFQDTLYAHSLRQFYTECNISGTVDFIFGNGAIVLQNCNITPRLPMSGQFNAITAQGRTDINQNTGTSIQDCMISPSLELAESNTSVKTYLGRPWKLYSRTVYMTTEMESLIDPAGWMEWDGSFALDTLYYAEFDNTGPGADTTGRVNWDGYHIINDTIADNFTVTNFIQGDIWLPPTGVPFSSGLLAS